jgi:hypothetical protein
MATFQQLSSGNWRILFYVDNIDGTRIRKSLTAPTREEAEKLAEDYIKNGLRLTVGEALDGYIDLNMQKPIMFQMKIDCLSIRMEHR